MVGDSNIRVPPPPPRVSDDTSTLAEVIIRTMASDVKSLGESGGLGTRGEMVSVPMHRPGPAAPQIPYSRIVVWTIVFLSAAGFLFLIGYYFIPALLGSGLQ